MYCSSWNCISLKVGHWRRPWHAHTQWIHMYRGHVVALVTFCDNKLTTGGTALKKKPEQMPPSRFIIIICEIQMWAGLFDLWFCWRGVVNFCNRFESIIIQLLWGFERVIRVPWGMTVTWNDQCYIFIPRINWPCRHSRMDNIMYSSLQDRHLIFKGTAFESMYKLGFSLFDCETLS